MIRHVSARQDNVRMSSGAIGRDQLNGFHFNVETMETRTTNRHMYPKFRQVAQVAPQVA